MKRLFTFIALLFPMLTILNILCCETVEQQESESVKMVKSSIHINMKINNVKEGALEGGIAVMIGNAAYWVKSGKVYAGNGTAKGMSPNIEYAPTGIDFSSIQEAVK